MSAAWYGFIKMVATLVFEICAVGLIGFLEDGWRGAAIGGVFGLIGGVWTIRTLVARLRARRVD